MNKDASTTPTDTPTTSCPTWCTYHPNGDYHARIVASDGRDRVVVNADVKPGSEPWVEAWLGTEQHVAVDEPLGSAIQRLDQLARMFLDAADELRKLDPAASRPTS